MILTPIAALMLAVQLLAPGMAPAGECHDSPIKPIVTNWTIVAEPGRIVIDATLEARDPDYPPSQYYYAIAGDAMWTHQISTRLVGQPGPVTDQDSRTTAVVTDSTLHIEILHAAGTYVYFAFINGKFHNETQVCAAYMHTDTLVILPDASDAKRASLGAVKARWAR